MAEALKGDAEFQQRAAGFDSKFQFISLPDSGAGVSEERACGLNLPQCDEVWLGKRSEGEVDIILEGKYGIMAKIFSSGKTNLLAALAMRSVRLRKGSAAKLTTYLGAVNRFIENSKKISVS
jgi:putative sterol carrier protein